MRRLLITIPVFAVLACDAGPEPARAGWGTAPPAAVLAPGTNLTLADQLRRVEAELAGAMEGEPERFLRAEAITDQLLHAPRDVDWLATGYSLESRVRQVQAMADGIVARLRRGASVAGVEEQVRLLRAAVQDLLRQLEMPGGGAAPPSLEQLLAQDPMRDASVRPAARVEGATATTPADSPATTPATTPAPAAARGPLGTPIRPDPDGL